MSLWGVDRLRKGLGGIVDVIEAPPQFLWDVGKALTDDDNEQGFWSAVWASGMNRAAQGMGGLFGPQGAGGQLAGGIPGPVRKPISTVFMGSTGGQSIDKPGFGMEEAFGGGALGLMEGLGREFIREPLSTAMTAASLDQSETWGKSWFDGQTWAKAHEIAQHRSVGQAVSYAIFTKDILNEDELTRAQGSAGHQFISGGFDAAMRIFADTDTVAGGFGLELVKANKTQRFSVATQRSVDAIAHRDSLRRYKAAVDAKKAGGLAADTGDEVADFGRTLAVPHSNAVETRLGVPNPNMGDDLLPAPGTPTVGPDSFDIVRPIDETTGKFAPPEAATVLPPTPAPPNDMRRAVHALLGEDVTNALIRAVDAAKTGDTTNLYKWGDKHGVKWSSAQVADIIDDPDLAYDLAARTVANKKGINTLVFKGPQGEDVGLLELSRRDTTLADAAGRAQKKFDKSDPNQLGRGEKLKDLGYLTWHTLRGRGWDGVFDAADRRVDKMSRNLRYARESFMTSPQWEKAKQHLASLDYDAEGIADAFRRAGQKVPAPVAKAAGVRDEAEDVVGKAGAFDTRLDLDRDIGARATQETIDRLLTGDRAFALVPEELMDRQGYDFHVPGMTPEDAEAINRAREDLDDILIQGSLDDARGGDATISAMERDLAGKPPTEAAARERYSALVADQMRTYVRRLLDDGHRVYLDEWTEAGGAAYRRITDPSAIPDEAWGFYASQGDDTFEGIVVVPKANTRGVKGDTIDRDFDALAATLSDLDAKYPLPDTLKDVNLNEIRRSPGLARRTEMIRDRFFHDSTDGDLMATLFAHAHSNADRDALMRMFLGEFPSVNAITDPGLKRAVTNIMKRRLMVRKLPIENGLIDDIEEFRLFNDPENWATNNRLAGLINPDKGFGVEFGEALDDIAFALGDEGAASLELQRMMQLAVEDKHLMRVTARGAIRANPTIQKVFHHKYNPTRVVFDMVAHPFINPDDPQVVGKVKRHLRDAGYDPAQIEEKLGQFAQIRWNDEHRKLFLDELANEGIDNLARKHGIEDRELLDLVKAKVSAAHKEGQLYAQQAVKYSGLDRVTNREFSRVSLVDPVTGVTEHVMLPMTPEQLQNAHLMPNFREIDKALKRVKDGPLKYGYVGKDAIMKYPSMVADAINRAWKPAVLLRPAWPMRVIFDEQLRMMSVLGVMNTLAEYPARYRDLKMRMMRDLFPMRDADRNALFMGVDEAGRMMPPTTDPGALRMAQPIADPKRAASWLGPVGAAIGGALAGPVGAAVGGGLGVYKGYRGAELANGLQYLHLSSTRNMALDGYTFMNSMGHPGDVANVYWDETSAGRQLDQLRGLSPSESLNRLRLDPRRWKHYNPNDAGYEGVWTNVVNKQFGNSEFARMLWSDDIADDDIIDWLHTAEGRQTLNAMPKQRRENVDEWVTQARSFINTNVLPPVEATMPLRERLAQGGHVTFAEVQEALGPNWDQTLGSIHGMELIEISDKGGELVRHARELMDNTFRRLGKIPTDALSRHPFFQNIYEREIAKGVAVITSSGPGPYRLSAKEIKNLEDGARRIALRSTRNTLYDLAEQSQFSQMVRNLMPFFNAWQEVITRYAGIAIDNPLYASRLYKTYQGLDNLGHYEDEYGNAFIRLRIPTPAKALLNKGFFRNAVDEQGYVMIDKRSLNMLAQGTPGFGPMVNISVGQVAKNRPELEESLGFMFPYGMTTSMADAFLPTSARRALSASSEDATFAKATGRIAIDKLIAAELRGEPIELDSPEQVAKFYADVEREAKAFFNLRTVSAFVSPLPPIWQSPYQDYIDEFRKLQRADPTTADEKFLEKHGEQYFALTQAMSRVLDGVPATIEGEQARAKYKELIEAYPEFGSLIIGSEGGGTGVKFSRAIYDRQFNEQISQGDPRARREMRPLNEIVTSPDARLGWIKWGKFYDWKVDQMARLGVQSMSQRAAAPIAIAQRAFIAQLRAQHPKWYEDFVDQDETKWLRRVKAFSAIAASGDPKLLNRPDIAGLTAYMDTRKQIEGILKARKAAGGSGNLTARSNADIRFAWEAKQQDLIEGNLAFSDLHGRWLQNDMIEESSWSVA